MNKLSFKAAIANIAGSVGSAVGTVAGVVVGVAVGAVVGGTAGFHMGDHAARAMVGEKPAQSNEPSTIDIVVEAFDVALDKAIADGTVEEVVMKRRGRKPKQSTIDQMHAEAAAILQGATS